MYLKVFFLYPLPEHPGPPTGVNISIQETEPEECRSRPVSISWYSPSAQETLSYIVTITSTTAPTSVIGRDTRLPMLTVKLHMGNYTVNITTNNIRCNLTGETASTELQGTT